MESLRHVLVNLSQGHGQIVCLIGEAGLGKSRLTRELRAEWESIRHEVSDEMNPQLPCIDWTEGRGISFDTTHPYYQFQQHTRQFYGLSENDSLDTVHQKILQPLKNSYPDKYARVGHIFEMLLGVYEVGESKLTFEGESFKRELFREIPDLLRHRTAYFPSVMLFEDLHWADSASVELLLHLLPLVTEIPILFLCVFRPDTAASSWQVKQKAETNYAQHYTEIALTPLSAEESNALVDGLLIISDLRGPIRQLIQQKSEGNPFFIEEVVRTLLDSGVIVRTEDGTHWQATRDVTDIAIPDNLQALLMARIDRLPEEVRHTLQLAAVIGRIFPRRVLEVMSDLPEYLTEQLSLLMRLGLVRRSPSLEETYIFHHVLTQQAAYNTLNSGEVDS